eukprot:15324926-Ditylum_brightwellii.AAC.1
MDFQDIMEGGIIQECCRNHTISSVVGAMMNTFIKSKSVSRDEASYMLGRGLYKQMSMPVKKCP